MATGKDTATWVLTKMDFAFSHFLHLKVGNGRGSGYELISADEASALRRRGDILYENTRVDSRLTAWDETWRDIKQHSIADFDLQIDTDRQCPDSAAHLVRSYLTSSRGI